MRPHSERLSVRGMGRARPSVEAVRRCEGGSAREIAAAAEAQGGGRRPPCVPGTGREHLSVKVMGCADEERWVRPHVAARGETHDVRGVPRASPGGWDPWALPRTVRGGVPAIP